ncbi:hypothetical protein Pint_33757 [Pistacia integerrima]|uniref:Uncharacterized protein n=1 Tax=Pistacia integerrima TaxID=434235 RepID=A0ACC0X4W5_9ROSI|nr:hypothetical protein Pint_33757 [Pistacia integerrima]
MVLEVEDGVEVEDGFVTFWLSEPKGSVSRNRGPRGQGGVGDVGGIVVPKPAKLDFPRYDGSEDLALWICRAEQFFEFQGTAFDDQVRLAAYHLEKDAQLWYQQRKTQEHLITWESMKVGLLARFVATEYEDFFRDLCKLKQTNSVSDYQAQFERLLACAGTLTDKQEVECFISGLKQGIRADNSAQSGTTTVGGTKGTTQERIIPIRKFSQTELQRRREQGLCYNCDEKYMFGHKCKKLFLIDAEEEIELSKVVEEDNHDCEEDETPAISLHALVGVQSSQTMHIQSRIGNTPLTVLIDSGSTHNFLHHGLAKMASLKPEIGCLLNVVVANGCDAVLGPQWLCTLGPILWDFSQMQMQFRKKVLLQGSLSFRLIALKGEIIPKTLRQSQGQAFLLQVCATQPSQTVDTSSKSQKLSPRFYGPYRVLERVGGVAYRLDLPPGTKIHPVFHVSLLKKQLSVRNTADSSLSIMSKDSGFLQPQPTAILNSRQRGRHRELLIHWQGLPATDATWEEEDSFNARFPDFTSP